MFAKVLLGLNGLAFVGYGLACLISPLLVAGYSGMELPNASALTEVVAMYGGLQIGVGGLFLYCAARPAHATLGLYVMVGLIGSLATARAIGLMIHGGSAYNLAALAYEATTTVLALAALKLSQAARQPA